MVDFSSRVNRAINDHATSTSAVEEAARETLARFLALVGELKAELQRRGVQPVTAQFAAGPHTEPGNVRIIRAVTGHDSDLAVEDASGWDLPIGHPLAADAAFKGQFWSPSQVQYLSLWIEHDTHRWVPINHYSATTGSGVLTRDIPSWRISPGLSIRAYPSALRFQVLDDDRSDPGPVVEDVLASAVARMLARAKKLGSS